MYVTILIMYVIVYRLTRRLLWWKRNQMGLRILQNSLGLGYQNPWTTPSQEREALQTQSFLNKRQQLLMWVITCGTWLGKIWIRIVSALKHREMVYARPKDHWQVNKNTAIPKKDCNFKKNLYEHIKKKWLPKSLWHSVDIDNVTQWTDAKLHVNTRGHVLHAYVNQQLIGTSNLVIKMHFNLYDR